MSWQFWKRREKNEEENKQLEQMQELMQEELTNVQSQMKNIGDQVTKLTRMQFKSSKNIEEKMDEFAKGLSAVNSQNDAIRHNERQQELLRQNMIRLLDEFDHVSSGIIENDQVWHPLIKEWSETLEKSLEQVGVYGLNVVGKTFDPKVAESVEAVAKDTLHTPPVVQYEVIDVLKRGYIDENGRLLRKAKVITVKEEV